MSRVKGGVSTKKRRNNLKKYAKGYMWGRNSRARKMREATLHAFSYMFAHRRKKKGDFRTLWNIQINAAARLNNTTYSKLIAGLTKNNILVNRKMLAELGKSYPEVFSKIANEAIK